MNFRKVEEWINSGEYNADIDAILSEIIQNARQSKNEAETASVFETSLYHLIRSKTGISIVYSKEQPVKRTCVHTFGSLRENDTKRVRLDAVVHNLVIEYKHFSRLETDTQKRSAIAQVMGYLNLLYSEEGVKYDAILTDGIKICYFSFVDDAIHYSMFSVLSKEDVKTVIQAIIYNSTKNLLLKI